MSQDLSGPAPFNTTAEMRLPSKLGTVPAWHVLGPRSTRIPSHRPFGSAVGSSLAYRHHIRDQK